MHEYDITLKSVLRRLTGSVLRELTGFTVTRWHNVELPAVQNRRADMLGETADGTLVHIELQSTNQAGMALRMLEYAAAIHRQFGRFPEQMVLYVGEAPLKMKSQLAGPRLEFACRIVDIRSLDGEALIASGRVEDNVIAVLARLGNAREAVKQILLKIGRSGPKRRGAAFEELMFLAGLRKLEPVIKREARQMPILNDIMHHAVIGRERKRGIKEGLEQGREQEREQSLARERQFVVRMIGKRFGTVPATVRKQVEGFSAPKLERIALRLFDARSLNELMK